MATCISPASADALGRARAPALVGPWPVRALVAGLERELAKMVGSWGSPPLLGELGDVGGSSLHQLGATGEAALGSGGRAHAEDSTASRRASERA